MLFLPVFLVTFRVRFLHNAFYKGITALCLCTRFRTEFLQHRFSLSCIFYTCPTLVLHLHYLCSSRFLLPKVAEPKLHIWFLLPDGVKVQRPFSGLLLKGVKVQSDIWELLRKGVKMRGNRKNATKNRLRQSRRPWVIRKIIRSRPSWTLRTCRQVLPRPCPLPRGS